MATGGKTYVVEDADENAKSKIPPGVFPGTLAGLIDALDAARYRSAAGTKTDHRGGQPPPGHSQVRQRH